MDQINPQIHPQFYKLAWAFHNENLSFQEFFREIKDCRARKFVLQSMSNFQVGCNLVRPMDPKCIQCPFNRDGQVILNFKDGDDRE